MKCASRGAWLKHADKEKSSCCLSIPGHSGELLWLRCPVSSSDMGDAARLELPSAMRTELAAFPIDGPSATPQRWLSETG